MSKKNTPGFLSMIFSVLAIVGYIIGISAGFALLQDLGIQVTNFSELVGAIVVDIVAFIIEFTIYIVFGLAASIAALLGQVWRQRRWLVGLSLLSLVGYLIPMGILTANAVNAGNLQVSDLGFWLVAVIMIILHVMGLRGRH